MVRRKIAVAGPGEPGPKASWLARFGEAEAPPEAGAAAPAPAEAPAKSHPKRAKDAKPRPGAAAWRRLLVKKRVDELVDEGLRETHLKRTLGPVSLILLGLGAIIGTGIFVLTGVAASQFAGPAISVAFLIAGIVAALAALAYAELASMIPLSGSAYTYTYAGLGEIVAWVIGWDLILEYAVGAMTVSVGWSGYVNGLLAQGGIAVPSDWANGPFDGGIANLLAVGIVAIVTAVLVYGIRESAEAASALVIVKVGIIVFVVLLGFTLVQPLNYVPFFHHEAGVGGVFTAAGLVFFAFIGFDALSTTAEETRNPRRDLPIGILVSLGVATLLYILASVALTGMVDYRDICVAEPFGCAFEDRGLAWAAALVRVGAAAGITSVLMVLLLAQPRIFYAMSRDGLLPRFFGLVHGRFRTPWVGTMITGLVVALAAGLLPIGILAQVTNIGTLFAFGLVSASVVVLRFTDPDAVRGYRMPLNVRVRDRDLPVLGVLGAASAFGLMFALKAITWLVFVFWFGLGLVVYSAYGYYRSRAARSGPSPAPRGAS